MWFRLGGYASCGTWDVSDVCASYKTATTAFLRSHDGRAPARASNARYRPWWLAARRVKTVDARAEASAAVISHRADTPRPRQSRGVPCTKRLVLFRSAVPLPGPPLDDAKKPQPENIKTQLITVNKLSGLFCYCEATTDIFTQKIGSFPLQQSICVNHTTTVSTVSPMSALEALCDYALYKSTFTLHYITCLLFFL